MSIVNARRAIAAPAPADRTNLFKEDRPRHIDQYISFFGDGDGDGSDACGEQLLETLSSDWPEQ